jgi:hypothetical protein
MFKFMFPAIMCVAMCCPMVSSAQDCCNPAPACCEAPAPCCEAPACCEPDPCCAKTRKKFTRVDTQRQVCRLKRQCVTDECGCTKKKFVRVSQTVSRKKLTRVEVPVDPCKKCCFSKLGNRMKSSGGKCGCKKADPCCEPAPAPCCEPTPCCS